MRKKNFLRALMDPVRDHKGLGNGRLLHVPAFIAEHDRVRIEQLPRALAVGEVCAYFHGDETGVCNVLRCRFFSIVEREGISEALFKKAKYLLPQLLARGPHTQGKRPVHCIFAVWKSSRHLSKEFQLASSALLFGALSPSPIDIHLIFHGDRPVWKHWVIVLALAIVKRLCSRLRELASVFRKDSLAR